jgi:hypothetical protein
MVKKLLVVIWILGAGYLVFFTDGDQAHTGCIHENQGMGR